ncbi:MAG: hypothetical protein V1859_04495 [archaeon]
MLYHAITQEEINAIIDAIVKGDVKSKIMPSQLEETLIMINQLIIPLQAIAPPQFPEEWGTAREVLAAEAALGIPRLKYFSKPRIEKSYF